MQSIMILGGETGSALGVVRSLGRRGIPIFVGGCYSRPLSGYSKYAKHRFRYAVKLEEAHQQVMETIKRWHPDVLLPVMDHAWSLVYARFDDYAKHTKIIPCPDAALRSEVNDKSRLAKIANEHGVLTPKTLRLRSLDETLSLRDELPYPLLLKPVQGSSGSGIHKVRDPKELEDALREWETIPLIQEFVEGEDLELTILAAHGNALAGSAYLGLRNYPLPYGPPVAARTIHDERLMAVGTKLLRSLKYHGVAHLDFRRDRRDGEPKLLDFNTRLAGTNEISTCTGVDFAWLLYRMATAQKVEPHFDYEIDVEFRWLLLGEIRHLAQTNRKGAAFRSLMRWKGVRTNVSLSDPLPHAIEALNFLQDKGSNAARRIRSWVRAIRARRSEGG